MAAWGYYCEILLLKFSERVREVNLCPEEVRARKHGPCIPHYHAQLFNWSFIWVLTFVVQTYRDPCQNSVLTGQRPLQEHKEVMKVCSWVAVDMDVLIVKGHYSVKIRVAPNYYWLVSLNFPVLSASSTTFIWCTASISLKISFTHCLSERVWPVSVFVLETDDLYLFLSLLTVCYALINMSYKFLFFLLPAITLWFWKWFKFNCNCSHQFESICCAVSCVQWMYPRLFEIGPRVAGSGPKSDPQQSYW